MNDFIWISYSESWRSHPPRQTEFFLFFAYIWEFFFFPIRHRWVWTQSSAVSGRRVRQQRRQLPVCVPRWTWDRARWLGLSRWVMRLSEWRVGRTTQKLFIWAFIPSFGKWNSHFGSLALKKVWMDDERRKLVIKWTVRLSSVGSFQSWVLGALWGSAYGPSVWVRSLDADECMRTKDLTKKQLKGTNYNFILC